MLDMYRMDALFSDYEAIRYELQAFSPELAEKQEIIVFSKADIVDSEIRDHII